MADTVQPLPAPPASDQPASDQPESAPASSAPASSSPASSSPASSSQAFSSPAASQTDAARPFPVVAVGASAGGVEALEGFFRGVPGRPGLAFVIVTHLSPERESALHQIVGRHTDLIVQVASDNAEIEADHVYVVPAGVILGIENRRLSVIKPNSARRERKPIDVFFSALANDRRELAIGVVLSGGDGDGTLGIKAIKERGGFTLAQVADGYGPRNSEMPDTAISTGFVDFAMPAEAMGAKLAELAKGLSLLGDLATQSRTTDDGKALDEARQEIYAILRTQLGHDFGGYKPKTFVRRVQRRMQVRQLDTIEAYVDLLRHDAQEVGTLFRDLLINVTNFFRDAEAFETLATLVVPKLFEGRGADDTIRVWVPGCATGEEVYSLGILMREHMSTLPVVPRVQLFATDIDEHALSVARLGRYPAALMESVSPERRTQFFISDGASYVVAKEVRDLCVFSPHSVIRDPPFSRIDMVSCRNLLIYFGADVQGDVIPTFHYALRPGGFLFLGSAESISAFGELFETVDKKLRIFRRRLGSSSNPRLSLALTGLRPGAMPDRPAHRPPLSGVALRHSVENQVLEQFAPPYVVVNQEGEIVFFSGRTGKYLEAAAGAPTRQILAVARKGLRLEMRAVLREAVETGRSASREAVAVEGDDGRVQMITLTIAPVVQREAGEPLYLVLFSDHGPTLTREEAALRPLRQDGDVAHLESALRESKERLQSLVEEYETALEELKASNEELVSVNEELQSTNEELEASKEELQSVNEELHTLNADLSNKIDALDRVNSDLQNLFDSTDIATVFLDEKLAIRSFTPAVEHVFNILPGDRGRPITDLSSRLPLPAFNEDIADVLASGKPVERRIAQENGRAHYLVRLQPYRDGRQRTRGVVVAFIDISSLTQAESRQRVLIAELQHRTRNLLAIVQSIAHQTFGRTDEMRSFGTRLAALGRVQGLISSATEEEIDLADVIRLELQAHGSGQGDRVHLEGPSVALDPERIQTFALALHELATNAVKYGALSGEAGRLEIVWKVVQDGHDGQGGPYLCLTWRESGVVMPPQIARRGYGSKLIEKALAFTLRAKTELVFGPDGVSCQIEMPLHVQTAATPAREA